MTKNHLVIYTAYNKGYRSSGNTLLSPVTDKRSNGILKSQLKRGYYCLTLFDQTIQIHRFVAYEKYGDKIFEQGVVVRHKDGNSLNNEPYNILIGTNSDNEMDKSPEVRYRGQFSYNDKRVTEMKLLRQGGASYRSLAIKYGCERSTLKKVLKRP